MRWLGHANANEEAILAFFYWFGNSAKRANLA